MAISVLASSSTMSILAVGSVFMIDSRNSLFAEEPNAQEREQFVRIDGLGDVIGSAGFETFFAIALHRLGRERKDRQKPVSGDCAGSCAWFRSRPFPAS